MARRHPRTNRIASVALLGTSVFANPPPVTTGAPRDVIVNRPNPAYDRKRVDAGTPLGIVVPPPGIILNSPAPVRDEPLVLPDGGSRPVKK